MTTKTKTGLKSQSKSQSKSKQALLNELEQLKSILDAPPEQTAVRRVSSAGRSTDANEDSGVGVEPPVLKETADEIPVLDHIVSNLEKVEVASYSRNPFLPDSIKQKLATQRPQAPESADNNTPLLTDRDKQKLVDDLVAECMPQIEIQLRSRLMKMLNEAVGAGENPSEKELGNL